MFSRALVVGALKVSAVPAAASWSGPSLKLSLAEFVANQQRMVDCGASFTSPMTSPVVTPSGVLNVWRPPAELINWGADSPTTVNLTGSLVGRNTLSLIVWFGPAI